MFPNKPKEATHYFMYPGHPTPGGNWAYYVSFSGKLQVSGWCTLPIPTMSTPAGHWLLDAIRIKA